MKLNLNPIQHLYNEASIAMDGFENKAEQVAQGIINRIHAIIGDTKSYRSIDSKEAKQCIKGFISLIEFLNYGECSAIDKAYIYMDLIQYMILDNKKHLRSSENIPEYASRLKWFQLIPAFECVTVEAIKELTSLVSLFSELAEVLDNSYLFHTEQTADDKLPRRMSLGCIARTDKGITEKDWQKVA